jgi:hypothetical protein
VIYANVLKSCFLLLALVAASCSADQTRYHSVGTYIGGSSLFGADECSYDASPGVLLHSDRSSKPQKGIAFVYAPGTIIQHCPAGDFKHKAIVPTAAKINGPNKVQHGDVSGYFSAHLYDKERELSGEGRVDWTLGQDCDGAGIGKHVASFSAVRGSQDTGGPDRGRSLMTSEPGKCTVIVTITTGSDLAGAFVGKSYRAEMLVSVE